MSNLGEFSQSSEIGRLVLQGKEKGYITYEEVNNALPSNFIAPEQIDGLMNVFGEKLELCCNNPKTGFYRDGFCNTGSSDYGTHVVCSVMTKEFLEFSKSVGNDLSTPRPEFGFEGLKAGDRWCLCADRWAQADANGAAPNVILRSTHINTLKTIPLEILRRKALDVN